MSDTEEIIIPERTSFRTLNDILLGYLKSNAYEKSVTYKDVAAITGIGGPDVSRNNKFFVAAGFLYQEKRGYYKLTDLGNKYAKAIDWKREVDAKNYLKTILNEYKLTQHVLNYVEIKYEVTRNDLITRIAVFSDVKREPRYVSGINAFIDMTLYSNLVKEDNNNITINKELLIKGEIDLPSTFTIEKIAEEPEKVTIEKEAILGKKISINLNININNLSDVILLKEVIKILKEEDESE